jgi:hypothetical protein
MIEKKNWKVYQMVEFQVEVILLKLDRMRKIWNRMDIEKKAMKNLIENIL